MDPVSIISGTLDHPTDVCLFKSTVVQKGMSCGAVVHAVQPLQIEDTEIQALPNDGVKLRDLGCDGRDTVILVK